MKIDTLFRTILGNINKFGFYYNYLLNKKIKKSSLVNQNIVVSLTSYGERVKDTASLAIYSVMKQSICPSAIVLWIDETQWNIDNLPDKIKYLVRNGLQVRFCKDIRSYTKLIPSLSTFPDKCIVTVDDDVYYSNEMIEELCSSHQSSPNAICCLHFCIVSKDSNNNIKPYYEWEECHVVSPSQKIPSNLIFPQGYGAVLYPPHIFDSSVFDMEIAKQLCPTADDVWFYCMGIKNKVKRVYAYNSKTRYYLVDMLRQLIKKDRLNETNVKIADNNEVQLKRVLEYYNIDIDE